MAALASDLRKQLENVCIAAREKAEEAARSALQKRAVDAAEPHSHFTAADKELRNRLRARGRQVGDVRHANKKQDIDQLTQELAYEYWHRMLFARFLAENHLLMHPDGVAVSLEECEELAKSDNAPNGFVLAARYASRMLPQVFHADDVLLEIEFAPEQRLALEKELAKLPQETFLADDGLGWVYQFWQNKKKEEINKSGEKIDGRTMPAVTQLFTEHYMVQFLLHNTIGAWWCGNHSITGPAGGAGIPDGQAPVEMEYLRWKDDGTPAAGTFPGWPKTLAEFTLLDPCCGSGHFLGAAFALLVPLRMKDEGLSAAEACDAVLKRNLFGLELDPRCTQIAAFALALAAWKYPDAGGYRELPPLNIACSGQGVSGRRDEWLALANGDNRLQSGMEGLYDLFIKAPHLGSLIDPRREAGDMFTAGYAELQPLLTKALAKHAGDADLQAVGVAARGITAAADLLARRYTLVITNVPYLGRGKQANVVKEYLEEYYDEGKADLATGFVMRCLDLCRPGGSTALVTPQNWLFQTTYKKLRHRLLKDRTWNLVASLGEEAWWSFGIRGPRTVLHVLTAVQPTLENHFFGIDVSTHRGETPILLEEKAIRLSNRTETSIRLVRQADELANPDAAVHLTVMKHGELLGSHATIVQGMGTGDLPRYLRCFWEFPNKQVDWDYFQTTPDNPGYSGYTGLIRWEQGKGELARIGTARKGLQIVGKQGIAVAVTGGLQWCWFIGTRFDCTIGVIIPNDLEKLLPIAAMISDPSFPQVVRACDPGISVTEASFLKVPFDSHIGKPSPPRSTRTACPNRTRTTPRSGCSKATSPPAPTRFRSPSPGCSATAGRNSRRPDAVDTFADDDGIVCLPGVARRAPAAERLRDVLTRPSAAKWSESVLTKLLTDAGCKAGATLDDWLADAVLRAALQAVPPAALRLAHLGRPQGRLRRPGELPQARPTSGWRT